MQRCNSVQSVSLFAPKLKTSLIFKDKPNGRIQRKNQKTPEELIVLVNENAWMNQNPKKPCIEKVWLVYSRCEESYLLLDECQVRNMSCIMKAFAAIRTKLMSF